MTLPTLAILAGGLATRLRPITQTIPKALVDVAGEPFLAHQLRLARRQGFTRVALLVGHLGEQIEAYAGDGSAFGIDLVYIHDGPLRRGTGDALRAAVPRLGDTAFVLYGDSYLDIDVDPVWRAFQASNSDWMMTVLHNRDRWDQSNIRFDGSYVLLHDKTSSGMPGVEWIDFGLSAFRTSTLASWPEADPFDLSTLTKALSERGALRGFAVDRRFYEIGKPEGLAETNAYIRSRAI